MPNEENDTLDPTGFGERVLAAMDRADAGWNLRPLAERLDVTYSNFWRWLYKTARGPDIDVYVRICAVLHCSLADLMDPKTRKEYLSLPDVAPPPVGKTRSDGFLVALDGIELNVSFMRRLVEGKEE